MGDFFFAGWVALTTYFFLGGRIWCRYFCPLISFLGVISSVGKFKIRPEPDKCISCGLCTRNCHMGIDVMNYAQKGIDMKEPSCVGCGICVEVCPMKLFSVKYDNKTVGNGQSFQIKSNPSSFTILNNSKKENPFTILSMGGLPDYKKKKFLAMAKLRKYMKNKKT